MPARASTRSVKSLMRKVERGDKLNILTFATHERYEENLCKTGHNFYSLKYGKEWDTTYAPVPENYHIVDNIPSWVDIDIVLSHTSCNRIQVAHDLLCGVQGLSNQIAVPILRHCHVLPDVRFDVAQETLQFASVPVDANSFISNFNQKSWGYSDENSTVIEHGVDTDFWWNADESLQQPVILSVVNDLPNRDWCCGFELWKKVVHDLPYKLVGKCTGKYENFSQPAKNKEELREHYRTSKVFLNTSLHSPVPTVLLEAMACGCAVVSTANCMIPDIIENGVNGFISNDPNELRACCKALVNDSGLLRKIGVNARRTILEKYNLNKFVDNWNSLLFSTIEKDALK